MGSPRTNRRRSCVANGLTLCLLPDPRVPLVTTALWFRAGTRNEARGQGGIAHFLEHMMFKGSARYPAGAVDRRTRLLGGANNAFTSHDATVYHFAFAADRWLEALAIEADRMAGLTLEPTEVASERRVILEEIAMVEDDPWDALEERVQAALFDGHAYGRPVLGSRGEVQGVGPEELRSFHQSYYRPQNAVLVVAGDVVAETARERIAEAFSPVAGGAEVAPSTAPKAFDGPTGASRLDLDRGEVPRLLVALPAPAVDALDHPPLRLALAVLALGRSSRLQRSLVEEGRLASWLSADLSETVEPGVATFALETAPGVEPERAEEVLSAGLAELQRRPPSPAELHRARAVLRAEWTFAHETLHQRALTLGFAVAFLDCEFPARYRQRLERLEVDEVVAAAERYLDPAVRGVVGWSGRGGCDGAAYAGRVVS